MSFAGGIVTKSKSPRRSSARFNRGGSWHRSLAAASRDSLNVERIPEKDEDTVFVDSQEPWKYRHTIFADDPGRLRTSENAKKELQIENTKDLCNVWALVGALFASFNLQMYFDILDNRDGVDKDLQFIVNLELSLTAMAGGNSVVMTITAVVLLSYLNRSTDQEIISRFLNRKISILIFKYTLILWINLLVGFLCCFSTCECILAALLDTYVHIYGQLPEAVYMFWGLSIFYALSSMVALTYIEFWIWRVLTKVEDGPVMEEAEAGRKATFWYEEPVQLSERRVPSKRGSLTAGGKGFDVSGGHGSDRGAVAQRS